MSPAKEIGLVIQTASFNEGFKARLLDPAQRREALKDLRLGNKRLIRVPLTDNEIAALGKIKADDLPSFAQQCLDYDRLMSEK
ncbi:MAG: hypothetical protein UT39_C0010G0014 [Candidatus Woesebacteria bacterium GW2011_GWA1_39_21]|uniref:Uncharacterized protein n=1 Tax=Candidatus Woesebacteria bacterium GW2011_GWA1_39_21 TaxID=1618550 RepID=A0A0G0NEG3_9BACT|nr:MAG: hypothetical protein UT39_C0010G0014 [Candidatus Woesebacteria bacterium GW2011_GWA1_39_21]